VFAYHCPCPVRLERTSSTRMSAGAAVAVTVLPPEIREAVIEQTLHSPPVPRIWEVPAGVRARILAAAREFARGRQGRAARRPVPIRARRAVLGCRTPRGRRVVRRASSRSPGRRNTGPEPDPSDVARRGGCFRLPGSRQ